MLLDPDRDPGQLDHILVREGELVPLLVRDVDLANRAAGTGLRLELQLDQFRAQAAPDDARSAELIPLLAERPQLENKATVYVCEHFTCKTPTADPKELAAQMASERSNTSSP